LNSQPESSTKVNINPDETGSIAAPTISSIQSRVPNSGGSQLYLDLEGDNLGGSGWNAKLERTGQEIPLSTYVFEHSKDRNDSIIGCNRLSSVHSRRSEPCGFLNRWAKFEKIDLE
jgi:hypothetical protein